MACVMVFRMLLKLCEKILLTFFGDILGTGNKCVPVLVICGASLMYVIIINNNNN